MRVFGIGDLHLSGGGQKPMDVFGPRWAGHRERLEANWRSTVGADDVVLICGDLSWAMTLQEARPDLDFIDSLPGIKYFIRGNHDYWCSRPGKVAAALGSTMRLVRFGAAVHGGVGICGERGWLWPGHPDFRPEEDERHWRRAILRLGMSLEALKKLKWDVAVAMFHYPPRTASCATELWEMVRQAGVRFCIYGHLHGEDADRAFDGEADGIVCRCVSADRVDFTPALLLERPA